MPSLKTLLICLTATIYPFSAQAQSNAPQHCSSEPVSAVYQVKMSENGKKSDKYQVELWRNAQQVAIRYPANAITELWELTVNNKLHLVRYFDAHGRGIEYQPNEIKGNQDWSLKRQLISDTLISQMALRKTRGKDCQTVEYYTKKSDDSKLDLQWFPKQQLIKHFKVKTSASETEWTLLETSKDAQQIAQEFQTLALYDTTDYTDIGDNESDPFLLNMINLGFVEHGGSGFYDADGHDIGDGHAHHH
jgi:hypothetical protein